MSRERGAWARWQETIQLVNCVEGGVRWADKEKQEPPESKETTHFGALSVLEADKERWEKAESPGSKCNLLLIMFSFICLADKEFPSCTNAMTLLIKTK